MHFSREWSLVDYYAPASDGRRRVVGVARAQLVVVNHVIVEPQAGEGGDIFDFFEGEGLVGL